VNEHRLILASASRARQQLLTDAGIAFEAHPALVDEDALKEKLRADNASVADAALALAALKAKKVAESNPQALIIGADQMLECAEAWFDKPATIGTARETLIALRGREHSLISGLVVVRDSAVLWRHTDRARLTMRNFSNDFLETYLKEIGTQACSSVGAYQLEGPGIQLFERVEGNFFTILGLPLLPLLAFLREQGAVAT